jgi:hypothetical protein
MFEPCSVGCHEARIKALESIVALLCGRLPATLEAEVMAICGTRDTAIKNSPWAKIAESMGGGAV